MGKPSKSRGRPSKFTPAMERQAKLLCELGATDQNLAEFFEVNVDSIYEWKKKYPEFSDAIKQGKDIHDDQIEESMAKAAKGHEGPDGKYYPPNPALAIFWMKNRRPEKWRDKQEIEHSGEVKTAVLELASGTGKPRKD
jgi:hypothetical protein